MTTQNYKMSITKKVIIFLFLGCIFPILLFGLFSINKINSVMEEEIENQTLNLLERKQKNLELIMQNIESLIINLSNLDEIRNILMDQTKNDSYNRLAAQAKMGYILSGYSNLKGLVSIDIFSMNNAHYHVGDTLNYREINEEQKSLIFSESLTASGSVRWHGVEDNVNKNSTHKKVIVASKILQVVNSDTMNEEPIGLIILNYDIDAFIKDIHASVFQSSTDIVFDTKGRIICYPDKNMVGKKIDPAFIAQLNQNRGSFTTTINGEPTMVTYVRSSISRWVTVGLIPLKAIKAKTSDVNNNMMLLIVFCFIMILLFTLFISKNYLSPIRRITRLFKELKDGNNDINIRLKKESDDEIGELVVWFNAFLNSLEGKKLAEEDLFKSREQYRSVVENVQEVIFQTDTEGNWTFLNPAWTDITGFTLKESLGSLFLNYVHPDDRQRNMELFQPLIERKKEYCRHIIRYMTKQDGFRWIEVFARLILDKDGNAVGTSGTLMDITERKNMEQELINREKLLKAISDATNVLLETTDYHCAFSKALGILGDVTRVDRVYIFENHVSPETSELLVSHRFEWCREGIESQADNSELLNLTHRDFGLQRLYNILSTNNVLSGLIRDFPQAEREILVSQGILSLIVVPIFIENNFWGFIGFDDCSKERVWTKIEENTLRVAAASIGGAFKRIQAEVALQEILKNDFTRTVKNLQNLVFKLKKNENGQAVFTLFEGKIANELGLNTGNVFEKTPFQVFGAETAELLYRQCQDAFIDGIKNFEIPVSDRVFLVTLSPIIEKGIIYEVVGSAIDISDHKMAQEKILHLAYYDALTDLPNRALFSERIELTISQADNNSTLVVVMFLDLDQFKLVNDTLGHVFGDILLQETAERLIRQIHHAEVISRMGGDEFALMFSDVNSSTDAIKLAEDVLNAFKEPFFINQCELYISASIGISLYPFDGPDMQTLLMNADAAMYRAKEHGRNCYQFFSTDMNAQDVTKLNLANNLRKAIDQKEFFLQYQPKIDTFTGAVKGCEALIRWRHPEMGLILPGRFIPLAEETGLIIPIGEWVLKTACYDCKKWIDAGYAHMNVSVNISAKQIHFPNIVDMVVHVLQETGLNPENLELEITENSIIKNTKKTLVTLEKLRSLGLKISIDDFGTGYSSMSYLKRFIVDKLKIDKSFIKDIISSSSDAAITSTIIHMAHKLNLTVVAEGVETLEQLTYLRILECDEIQGYIYSKPLGEEEILIFLFKQVLNSEGN